GILITLTGLVSLTIATGIQDYHRAKRMQPIVNQLYTILAEDDNIISSEEKSKNLKYKKKLQFIWKRNTL
ncbi:MAG TPA: hypothetical protein VJK51_05045, partial [Candidatus Nanoarchaeia archaeon]|nr:hypothetical protein [Candidatus Nanoarchaeia archaeon]